MQVDAMARRSRKATKVQIKNLPSHVTREEVEHLINSTLGTGTAQKYEEVGAEGAVYVTFDTPEQAQQAVTTLDGYNFDGSQIKVDFASNKSPRRPRTTVNNNSGMNRPELPLRIVVGSEYVGAVIGKGGQTIKNITFQSKARVDIHRRDNIAPETLVTIKGSPEACSKACKEIMKVVQAEAQSLNRGDCPLRILCPNSLCGRIIGKKGNVIKSFMEKSGTNIVVSSFESPYPGSMSDMNSYYMDRVITVTGNLDDAIKAEEMLSEKMRQCFEQDANMYQQQQMMFGGLPTLPMMPGGMNNYPGVRPPYPYMGGNYYPSTFGGPSPSTPQQQQQLEVVYLYIPEQSVGAVIGSKGQNIKNIMRLSGARIKIMGGESKNSNATSDKPGHSAPQALEERKVIITGSPEAQWKAQFYIFEKVKSEMRLAAQDEVHLRSEVVVPKATIGRIIGKGGQNVKEMQRVSGAIVQVPEDQGDVEEVPVTIIGHFYACQSAQRRIRALMTNVQGIQQQQQPRRGGRPGPGGQQQASQLSQINGN
ncbi:insulin-like growth factor 2 mRNA-binding protein 2 [Pomacea canaliculata]|nr:insulin-like growth factor 2 mRNA-binding protein 2 [Pomacea canaliculata]